MGFLLYDFLNKLSIELNALMDGDNGMDIPEFDELISLRQVVLINIYNKNIIHVKYFCHEYYQGDDLVSICLMV